MAGWIQLRDKPNLDDDPAIKTLQSAFDLQQQMEEGLRLVDGPISKIAVGFFDSNGRLVFDENRGSFSYQFVEISYDYEPTKVIDPFPIDSVLFTGGIGYRAILAPPNSSDLFRATVRLQDIVAPEAAVRIRILYKEA